MSESTPAQECAAVALSDDAVAKRRQALDEGLTSVLARARNAAALGRFSVVLKIEREYLSEMLSMVAALGFDTQKAPRWENGDSVDVVIGWSSAVKTIVMEANEAQG